MAGSASIKVPYKNLRKEAEVEMVVTDDVHHQIDLNASPPFSSRPAVPNGSPNFAIREKRCSLTTLILSCTVAAGVQFGWALQLSLLTPYIQVEIYSFSFLVGYFFFLFFFFSLFFFSTVLNAGGWPYHFT